MIPREIRFYRWVDRTLEKVAARTRITPRSIGVVAIILMVILGLLLLLL